MHWTPFSNGFAREVSGSLGQCELLHLERKSFDIGLARRQHADYVAALEAAGVRMEVLPEEPMLPDAVFVEDPALMLDHAAIICRPGAASRRPETERLAKVISGMRPTFEIVAPGTLEGGDVLRVGRTLYVGLSSRTNAEGVRQLTALASPMGYAVIPVPVSGCLHLKTAATAPREDLLLVNPSWIDVSRFQGFEILPVPAEEPWGANTLPVNGRVFIPASMRRTQDLLRSRGVEATPLEVSELQKAEGSVTCLSLLY